MKLLVNRLPKYEAWGGGARFVNALYEEAEKQGIKIGNRPNQIYDAALVIDPRPDELGVSMDDVARLKAFNPKMKVFQRVNECDARKGLKDDIDPLLLAYSHVVDHTFFVSNWMRDYHVNKGWKCQSHSVVYNGVDRNVFRQWQKLSNGKTNILSFHWSNNKFKGHDVHAWLDDFVGKHSDRFTYTFVGRHSNDFKNTVQVMPLWGEQLGREIAKYDISITGTVSDPGPNTVIESITCGLPTYAHVRGGGAVEFVGQDHTYSNADELEKLLLGEKFELNKTTFADWTSCINKYLSSIRNVLNG